MKARRLVVGVVPMMCGLLMQCGGETVDLSRTLPTGAAAWHAGDEDARYDRETLYDYMDGGAEVYLAFDFRDVFVRRYVRDGAEDIVLDIYDMGSPAEAFGVFSCDREDPDAGIGQGSEYGFGMLRFWQNRFFVTIIASGDDESSEAAILELGRSVAGVLGPDGQPPAILRMLPADGLIEERTSFFHSAINLNNRYFIASDNILNLGPNTDCVFAEYGGDGDESLKLMVVSYPDDEAANAAYRSFIDGYAPEARDSGEAQMEDGGWTRARVHGSYLAMVFDAPTADAARRVESAIGFPPG